MFLLAVLVILSPAVRRVLARVGNRSRNGSREGPVTGRTSELQRALETLDGSKQLELHLRFPVLAPGDAERFSGAVEQFLRNADSSAAPGSTIRVEAFEADDRVHVVISDERRVPADRVLPAAASAVRPRRSDDAGELPEPYDLRGVA